MAGKMSPKFIALCSLAVGAIYSSGYSITANGNTALAAPPSQQSNTALPSGGSVSPAGGTSTGSGGNSSNHTGGTQHASTQTVSKGSSSTTKTTTVNHPAQPQPQYLDGTYNGSASNQIGSVAVAVSISHGKIANVQITACNTHYPQGYIEPVLPDYVVAHQTTNIPVVSGATLSTVDFYYAVVQALSQAQNPKYKG